MESAAAKSMLPSIESKIFPAAACGICASLLHALSESENDNTKRNMAIQCIYVERTQFPRRADTQNVRKTHNIRKPRSTVYIYVIQITRTLYIYI